MYRSFTVCFALSIISVTISIAQPLTGSKTIGGTTPDYNTISSAIGDLSGRGVGAGGVTFQVRPGNYAEFVTVPNITGSSAANPVVFKNSGGTVTITPPVIRGTGAAAGVKFYGCSYITFDGINVTDTTTGEPYLYYGYWITNSSSTQGSQYNTVKNATITMRKDFTTTYGIYQYFNTGAYPQSTSASSSYNKYLNLKISKVRTGVYLYSYSAYPDAGVEVGSDSVGVNYPKRFTIGALANDTIGGNGIAYGMYCYYMNGLTIHDIDIRNLITTYSAGAVYGIYHYYASTGTTSIYNNRIYNLSDNAANTGGSYRPIYGIYNYYSTNPVRIYNNMIYDLHADGNGSPTATMTVAGIYNYYSTAKIDNNTILINPGVAGSYPSAAIYLAGSATYIDTLRNNILANTTPFQVSPYLHYGIYNSSITSWYSNNNVFYIPNTGGGYIGYNSSTNCATLTAWQATNGRPDMNSYVGDPRFVSTVTPYDLHIQPYQSTSYVDNNGVPVTGLTTDIDGQIRNTTTSDIGADEGNFTAQMTLIRPVGGETFILGTTDTIRWQGTGLTGNVRITLNRNYPNGTWDSITTVAADATPYLWNVVSPVSSNARVRVTSVSIPTAYDSSDANFTIANPTLTLQHPTGGDILYIGSPDTVRWSSNLNGTVSIQLNRTYPTGIWTTLTTTVPATQGYFVYNITPPATTSARYRIFSNVLPAVSDSSRSAVTIRTRTMYINHPNGGEILLNGVPDTIRWTNYGTYPFEVGISFAGINPDSVQVLSVTLPPNSTSFVWTPSGRTGTRCRIYLLDINGVEAWSSSDFSILQPSFSISRPNGGETFYVGERDTIRWTSQNVSGTVRIELNRSYPTGAWTVLDSVTNVSQGYWAWTPPSGSTSTSARIRLSSNSYPVINSISAANFSVLQRSLVLNRPNGGEIFLTRLSDTIRYRGQYLPNGVRIELNRTYPTGAWESLADSVSTSDSVWVWNQVTTPVTSSARIRVTARGLAYSYGDTSNANFTIQQSYITLNHPSGGETLYIGTSDTVRWTTNIVGSVAISYNSNYPTGIWTVFAMSVPASQGYYVYNVLPPTSNTARYAITSNLQPSITDSSHTNVLVRPRSMQLTHPNGGETLLIGVSDTIRWNNFGTYPMLVGISYAGANRDSVQTLSSTLPIGASSFIWTPTGRTGTRCRIYLIDAVGTEAWSSNDFTIAQPSITVSRPNGGEIFYQGEQDTIRWTSQNVTGAVKIEINRTYPTGAWTTLDTLTSVSQGYWAWSAVSGPVTPTARIRVSCKLYLFVNSTSVANFTIRQRSLVLNRPNGSEVFKVGLPDTIRFSGQYLPYGVRIELNRSYPSTTWETVFDSVGTNDSIKIWNPVTSPYSGTARIRVSARNLAPYNYRDTSNANFTISRSAVSLTRPIGGETVYIGAPDTVKWTSNIFGTVTIKYNNNYPTGAWTTLASGVPVSQGYYRYTVNSTASSNARYCIASDINPTIADTSSASVIISPRSMVLTHPNGGEMLLLGVADTIRWNNFGTYPSYIGISYASAVPESVVTISNAVPANSTSYIWTPSGRTGTTCRIFLRDTTGIVGWSAGNFSVVQPRITLTRPVGGEIMYQGERDTIRWTSQNVSGTVKIEINRSYPTGGWQILNSTIDVSQGFYWWPGVSGSTTTARVRISCNSYPVVSNTSPANFSILQRSLVLTRPVGGETFRVLSRDTVRYRAQYLPYGVRIELNRTYPGGTWELLADSVGGNDSIWVWNSVNAPVSTTARIRVTSRNLSYSYGDTSDANFQIQPQPSLYQSLSTMNFAGTRPFRTDSVYMIIASRSNLAFHYLTVNLGTGYFSYRIVNSSTLIGVNDSLRLWVKFTPDSTRTFVDTLRLTFDSPYNAVAVPITGLGIGTYTYLSASTLAFPNSVEPSRRDSLSVVVSVLGNRALQNATWVTLPTGAPFRAAPATMPTMNPGDTMSVKVYFEPLTTGTFNGRVALICHAINGDTLFINVSGTSRNIPATPKLAITISGYDAILNWTRIDSSISGVPLTVQNYFIYTRNSYSTGSWGFFTATTGAGSTSYTHSAVLLFSTTKYYRVSAYTSGSSDSDRIIRSIPVGTPENEVMRYLNEMQSKPVEVKSK